MDNVRVRFAPSPTGPLHIGGVRTALYTYLIAKKYKGDFILRIEDTDQNRYVEGAEDYIIRSLEWCGITPDEGPGFGGDYGPYRQSERKDIYGKYAKQLVEAGKAYYAFDSAEEISEMRTRLEAEGNRAPKYDHSSRLSMKNSLTLTEKETADLLASSDDVIVRLKIEPGEEIVVNDIIRGEVKFNSSELDDKVLLKADGMPTYHMANIVDDKLMKISHVIRGEEWLPSTAHHVLLYRALGWEETMPKFAHLSLLLKPNGKGKLSKRDGAKFGFPVFPLEWKAETEEDSFTGFREFGFDPKATVNFLAFLGWNPGTEQEIFTIEELAEAFNLDQIVKSGARFDIDKAKWYNQQYIINSDNKDIAAYLKVFDAETYEKVSDEYLEEFVGLMKERVELYGDFYDSGYYFFEDIKSYEEKMIRKKWKDHRPEKFAKFSEQLSTNKFSSESLKGELEAFIKEEEIGYGDIMPFLRLATTGTMQGPDLFQTMELLGKEKSLKRLGEGLNHFNQVVS
ncbi:glutamate--tRNA ligase [Portibacter lacus]|uniref:Glutamate--tRNA ligase n=1 Tax=Portibacter lacus TaxID=1099794 RepID=A0AA37SSC9_9BACT|nr:glutamate--tRNA ligase [Portibacter lacus]GLR18589.1 glutamate--tRNA ligase [Portibacter lacus]